MTHPTHHFIVKRDFGRHGWGFVECDAASLDDCIAALIESFDGDETGVLPAVDTVLVLEIDGAVAMPRTEDALAKIAFCKVWRMPNGNRAGDFTRAYWAESETAEFYAA